jgi:hypothetical protein
MARREYPVTRRKASCRTHRRIQELMPIVRIDLHDRNMNRGYLRIEDNLLDNRTSQTIQFCNNGPGTRERPL